MIVKNKKVIKVESVVTEKIARFKPNFVQIMQDNHTRVVEHFQSQDIEELKEKIAKFATILE